MTRNVYYLKVNKHKRECAALIHCLQQSTDKVVDWSAFLLEDEEDGGDDDDVLHLSNHL